ncbi:hypothetical protein ABZ697_31125 [Streptomyces albidoflavus]
MPFWSPRRETHRDDERRSNQLLDALDSLTEETGLRPDHTYPRRG